MPAMTSLTRLGESMALVPPSGGQSHALRIVDPETSKSLSAFLGQPQPPKPPFPLFVWAHTTRSGRDEQDNLKERVPWLMRLDPRCIMF